MERNWSGKTQGGTFGQKFVLFYFKYGSLRFMYLILYLVIPFYILFDKKGVNAIKWYALNGLKMNPKQKWNFIFKVYHNFGQVFLDRFAIFGNPKTKFQFIVENQKAFDQLISSDKGFIIVSAHFGNFELMSYSMGKMKKTLHPILFGGEADVFRKLRETIFKDKNIEPIVLDQSGSYIFEIHSALQKGDVVSMTADRTFGNMKQFKTLFLNHNATFPLGVFQIAASLDLPIVSIFVLKEGFKTYKVYVNPIQFNENSINHSEKAKLLGSQYVQHLENLIKKYPTQWYNFYPFWDKQA